MPAIEVHDLHKDYGDQRAVDGVSFEVAAGEVYALLGHNGAGKTTTVEILEGHRHATSGSVAVLGLDPVTAGRELRDRIGIVLQSAGVEPLLTVREALDAYGAGYRRRRAIDDLLSMAGLEEKADARIGSLSGGQRRRLDLALGIAGEPEVLFLDEPTTGFDPVARRQSWQLIERLCAVGTTVLLTTHYLDEAEHLADRVGVLVRGRLVAEGPPAELVADLAGTRVSFDLPEGLAAADIAGVIPGDATVDGRHVEFASRTPTAAVAAVTNWAVAHDVELGSLAVGRPTLEDVFLQLAATHSADGGDGGDSEPAAREPQW